MKKYTVVYTKQALKDAKKAASSGLKPKILELISLIEQDPFTEYPPFEKLIGDLSGVFSRRINMQHRLVYQVFESENVVKIIRMWTHYE